jgi:hypothetical protein
MKGTHKRPMGAFLAAVLALVAMACTCGPLSTAQNTQATAQAAVEVGQEALTQMGEQMPTVEAAMTQAAENLPTAEAAMTQAAPAVEEAMEQLGTVTGQVCYPSEGIPPMTIYAQNRATGVTLSLDHPDGSQQYTFGNLPPGEYVFFAYTNFGSGEELSGGYTEYVNNPDGSHNLVPVQVGPGATVTGVDLCDWYAPPGESDIPPQP